MIHAFVPRKSEPETPKPIMFSISEVENIIATVVAKINATGIVTENDIDIAFVRDVKELGGVVYVLKGNRACSFPVKLLKQEKGGE